MTKQLPTAWRVQRDPVFGCLLWTGDLTPNGYPVLGRATPHRMAYEVARGPIGAELVLDHMCRRRRCVNVDHLEAVTKSENERRKAMRYLLKRKQCPRGHALTEASRIVTPEMGVLCRHCALEAARGGGRP